ncbi:MAG: hypothetical protein HY548_05995 [Elusimicrobia bacterium]|nr:hypothetical protein [Elusimicrobiota bacterium]
MNRFRASWAGWLLIFGFFLSHFFTLPYLPGVNGDETNESQHAAALLATGDFGYPIAGGVYSDRFAFMTHALPNSIRPFYLYAVAAAFKAFGVGVWQARLVSLISATTVLCFFYAVGWKLWQGFWGYQMPVLSGDAAGLFQNEVLRYVYPKAANYTMETAFFRWAARGEYVLVAAAFLGVLFFVKRTKFDDWVVATASGWLCSSRTKTRVTSPC